MIIASFMVSMLGQVRGLVKEGGGRREGGQGLSLGENGFQSAEETA